MWFVRLIRNLFASIFGGGQPPQGQVVGYGFAWRPNTAYNNLQFRTLRDTDGPGLYIAVDDNVINSPTAFFEDANAHIGIIFAPQQASQALTQAVQHLAPGANLLQRLEGFLQYAHACLTYICATQAGLNLVTAINNSQHRVYIKPSNMGNQIVGAGEKMCFVARAVINSNLNLTQQENAQLMQELATASGQAGQPAQFQWLEQQVNQMPLYTLYEQENVFPQTFLQNNNPVTAVELTDWFANGSNSQFIQQLAQVPAVNGVSLVRCLKNAVIVALYPHSAAGAGGGSTIYFDVHDWSANTVGVDQTLNTIADRPPAIGLAHEMIHAYYNAIGREPGYESDHFTTTLAECICVGLGPAWNNNAISENAIRAGWPPGAVPNNDALNNRNAGLRLIYEAPQPPDTAADMRQQNSPI